MLLQQIISYIQHHRLFAKTDRLLIAVSGGIDSVVLTDLLVKAGYQVELAHCNFQLRNTESDADEQFVRSLGEKYQVKVHCTVFDASDFSNTKSANIQSAARILRYQWFRKLAQENNLKGIVTAHHADDNIETVLMNYFKGTGIRGMRGMVPLQKGADGMVIRPLLAARKAEIKAYAETNQLDWRDDSSNTSSKYTRNFFRNDIIPLIRTILPEVESNIISNIERFQSAALIYENAMRKTIDKLVLQKGDELHIPLLKLQKTPGFTAVLHELVVPYGFSSSCVHEVAKLMDAPSGKMIISETHRILRNRNWLIVAPLHSPDPGIIVLSENDCLADWGIQQLRLQFTDRPEAISSDPHKVQLDASAIRYPLIIRAWKTGDYFYPLGMRKKKKLSRFFIDQKISLIEKEKIRVLESDGRIVWVIGMRIDDRFKITDKTKKVLNCSLIRSK